MGCSGIEMYPLKRRYAPTSATAVSISAARAAESTQPERVRDHAHRAERHRRTRQDRREEHARDRVEHARRDRDPEHVVEERPEQVLPDDTHRPPRKLDRRDDAAQVAADQRDVTRLE